MNQQSQHAALLQTFKNRSLSTLGSPLKHLLEINSAVLERSSLRPKPPTLNDTIMGAPRLNGAQVGKIAKDWQPAHDVPLLANLLPSVDSKYCTLVPYKRLANENSAVLTHTDSKGNYKSLRSRVFSLNPQHSLNHDHLSAFSSPRIKGNRSQQSRPLYKLPSFAISQTRNPIQIDMRGSPLQKSRHKSTAKRLESIEIQKTIDHEIEEYIATLDERALVDKYNHDKETLIADACRFIKKGLRARRNVNAQLKSQRKNQSSPDVRSQNQKIVQPPSNVGLGVTPHHTHTSNVLKSLLQLQIETIHKSIEIEAKQRKRAERMFRHRLRLVDKSS